jgi:LAO/AO transport system kinase
MDDLIAEFRSGNPRALARAITLVERGDPALRGLLAALGPELRRPAVVGLTGAPGTGKSTLVDALISRLRARGQRVAVIAADPNSPYTGGAVLGDRIRMQRHAGDADVYIRSMGARGHLGGLPLAAREAVRLLGAQGFDVVLVETVGVGQAELEVVAVADTTLVVLTPDSGDGVQMMKAGIMEVADIFVVNKADLPSAQRTVAEVRSMLSLGPPRPWRPPIVPTVALRGEGLEDLVGELDRHRRHLEESGAGRERELSRLRDEAADMVGEWARQRARQRLDEDPALVQRMLGDRSPYRVAAEIFSEPGAPAG